PNAPQPLSVRPSWPGVEARPLGPALSSAAQKLPHASWRGLRWLQLHSRICRSLLRADVAAAIDEAEALRRLEREFSSGRDRSLDAGPFKTPLHFRLSNAVDEDIKIR
ncbi:hypothetical protein BOX15_Mlig008676g4, partial [Macrostomum lignano]